MSAIRRQKLRYAGISPACRQVVHGCEKVSEGGRMVGNGGSLQQGNSQGTRTHDEVGSRRVLGQGDLVSFSEKRFADLG